MGNQTPTLTRNKARELNTLRSEVRRLRSVVIGLLGEDSEGTYNPAFVAKILKASHEAPSHTFRNAKTFLAGLKGAK